MLGVNTNSKPTHSTKELVVVDINADRIGFCSDQVGLEMQVSPRYSVFLKDYISEKDFRTFTEEVDKALATGHKQGCPVAVKVLMIPLLIPVVLLAMLSGESNLVGACSKKNEHHLIDIGLDNVRVVVDKWNDRFAADDIPCGMQVQCLRQFQNAVRDNLRDSPGSSRGADWRDMEKISNELWIEMELGEIKKKRKSKKSSSTKRHHHHH